MCTSRIAFISMMLMLVKGGFSSPRRTTFADFRETATTEGNYPVPESHFNMNGTLHNSGWPSTSGDQSVTSKAFGGRPAGVPKNGLGTIDDDSNGLPDSLSRIETSTQFPKEWSDTTTSIWGTTTRSSSDYTTTVVSSPGESRDRSCGMVPSPGECQAAFPRYFYNASTSQCDCYIFGGCDEGEGSYRSFEDCQRKCLPESMEEGPSCKFVYVNFNLDHYTTTLRTTVSDFDLANNERESGPANVTNIFRNHSQSDSVSSVQEFSSSPDNKLGLGNVTTIYQASWSQNGSNTWSTNTPRSTTPSMSLATEELLPSKCSVFSKRGNCNSGSPRYYYNHTSSQCNCYNYSVCGETEESFVTLEECVQTCNPILRHQGPSCPVPPIRKSRPTAFGTTNSGSDPTSANSTIGSALSSDNWRPIRFNSPSSTTSSLRKNEKPGGDDADDED